MKIKCWETGQEFKVPKQIYHWFYSAGIKPCYGKRSFNWVGRGRRWRLNTLGQIQSSVGINKFERWAVSVHKSARIPQSKAEFDRFIRKSSPAGLNR